VHDRKLPHLGGGERGIITTFSRKSRGRLLLRMAQLHDAEKGHFVTLTYPGQFPTDPLVFKRHLKIWVQRLRRKYPTARAIWRLEFQKRHAPHYHMLVFGIPDRVTDVREWCALSWYKVVGSNDTRHLRAGIRVDRIENRAHAMRYAAKYAAKVDGQDLEGDYGRRWGHFGGCNFDALETIPLSAGQFFELQRQTNKWLNSRLDAHGRKMRGAHRAHARATSTQRNRAQTWFGLGDASQAARSGIDRPYYERTIRKIVAALDATYQKRADFAPDGWARWAAYRIELHRRWVARNAQLYVEQSVQFHNNYG
jgi:hypothetical protein